MKLFFLSCGCNRYSDTQYVLRICFSHKAFLMAGMIEEVCSICLCVWSDEWKWQGHFLCLDEAMWACAEGRECQEVQWYFHLGIWEEEIDNKSLNKGWTSHAPCTGHKGLLFFPASFIRNKKIMILLDSIMSFNLFHFSNTYIMHKQHYSPIKHNIITDHITVTYLSLVLIPLSLCI